MASVVRLSIRVLLATSLGVMDVGYLEGHASRANRSSLVLVQVDYHRRLLVVVADRSVDLIEVRLGVLVGSAVQELGVSHIGLCLEAEACPAGVAHVAVRGVQTVIHLQLLQRHFLVPNRVLVRYVNLGVLGALQATLGVLRPVGHRRVDRAKLRALSYKAIIALVLLVHNSIEGSDIVLLAHYRLNHFELKVRLGHTMLCTFRARRSNRSFQVELSRVLILG